MGMPETKPYKYMFSNCSEFETKFPYDDLLDYAGGYGGKLCKHFTDKPIERKRRNRPIKGQLEMEVQT